MSSKYIHPGPLGLCRYFQGEDYNDILEIDQYAWAKKLMSIIPNELMAFYELIHSFESAALFSDDVIEEIPLICILADKGGQVIRINRFAEEFFFKKKSEVVGRSVPSIMSSVSQKEFMKFFDKLNQGDREPFQYIEENKEQYINWKGIVLDGPNSHTPIAVILGDDVTETVSLKSSAYSARAVQKALLPTDFNVPGINMKWIYESAEATGGDWFDYKYDERSKRLLVCIADVNGHGTAAAMVTGCIAGLFHGVMKSLVDSIDNDQDLLTTFAANLNSSIFHILERANRLLTMAAVSINTETGKGAYISCGHPRVILFADGKAKPLLNRNSPIGVLPEQSFESVAFNLMPSESILMYTDGLTENKDINGRSLSSRELLTNLKKDHSEHIKFNWLRHFVKQMECVPPNNDDIALVVLTLLDRVDRKVG